MGIKITGAQPRVHFCFAVVILKKKLFNNKTENVGRGYIDIIDIKLFIIKTIIIKVIYGKLES